MRESNLLLFREGMCGEQSQGAVGGASISHSRRPPGPTRSSEAHIDQPPPRRPLPPSPAPRRLRSGHRSGAMPWLLAISVSCFEAATAGAALPSCNADPWSNVGASLSGAPSAGPANGLLRPRLGSTLAAGGAAPGARHRHNRQAIAGLLPPRQPKT